MLILGVEKMQMSNLDTIRILLTSSLLLDCRSATLRDSVVRGQTYWLWH